MVTCGGEYKGMGQKEKRLARLLSKPSDYTFDELNTLLTGLRFELDNKGSTSGSRVRFCRPEDQAVIDLHKPHNPNYLKRYLIDKIIDTLKEHGDIDE